MLFFFDIGDGRRHRRRHRPRRQFHTYLSILCSDNEDATIEKKSQIQRMTLFFLFCYCILNVFSGFVFLSFVMSHSANFNTSRRRKKKKHTHTNTYSEFIFNISFHSIFIFSAKMCILYRCNLGCVLYHILVNFPILFSVRFFALQ